MNPLHTLYPFDYPVNTLQENQIQPQAMQAPEKNSFPLTEKQHAEEILPEEDKFFNRSFCGFWRIS